MPLESQTPGGEQMAGSGRSVADADWVRSAVDRFENPLMLYTRHLLGGDAEAARDVVQESFLRLIRQDPDKVTPHLAEWLYTVCRNLAIDARRKRQRTQLLKDADADAAMANSPEPGARAERDDVYAHVMCLLNRLPRNQQECIRLKFQGGLSYKQISKVTGLTVTNVGFLIHTGLKAVRRSVSDEPRQMRIPQAARKES
jgi:RNA polymerase sigma factor (sigma-70 family)